MTGISPPVGPTSGGTWVLISGTNLTDGTAVDFGSTPAADIFPVYFGTPGAQPPGPHSRGHGGQRRRDRGRRNFNDVAG